jgi:hypothetical protein
MTITFRKTRIWGKEPCFNIVGTDLGHKEKLLEQVKEAQKKYPNHHYKFERDDEDEDKDLPWALSFDRTNAQPGERPLWVNTYTDLRDFVVNVLRGHSVDG